MRHRVDGLVTPIQEVGRPEETAPEQNARGGREPGPTELTPVGRDIAGRRGTGQVRGPGIPVRVLHRVGERLDQERRCAPFQSARDPPGGAPREATLDGLDQGAFQRAQAQQDHAVHSLPPETEQLELVTARIEDDDGGDAGVLAPEPPELAERQAGSRARVHHHAVHRLSLHEARHGAPASRGDQVVPPAELGRDTGPQQGVVGGQEEEGGQRGVRRLRLRG